MAKSKLINRNVPETFYMRFLSNLPKTTSLLIKLDGIQATPRGRGMSRVIPEMTEAEWEELYQYAADARAQMQGCDRETTLRPAICARALAEAMEKAGVANPVQYTPKVKRTVKPKEAVAPVINDTDLSSTVLPTNPPVVDQTADVEEASDDDLNSMHGDLAIGS